MPTLFSNLQAVTGWTSKRRSVGSAHQHATNWTVAHCGHGTAHHPWEVLSPEGRVLLTPAGLYWDNLSAAKAAVEAIVAGKAATSMDGRGRLVFSPSPQPTESAGKAAGVAEQ